MGQRRSEGERDADGSVRRRIRPLQLELAVVKAVAAAAHVRRAPRLVEGMAERGLQAGDLGRHVDELTATRSPALRQRGQRPDSHVGRAVQVRLGRPPTQRGPVRVADQRGPTPGSADDEIRGRPVRLGPIEPERGQHHDHQARVDRGELVVGERHLDRPARPQQDVAVRDEVVEARTSGGSREIGHHRSLAAVVCPMPQAGVRARSIPSERWTPPCRGTAGRFDQQHLGTELSEHESGELAAFVGAVDHTTPRQHPHTPSWRHGRHRV